MEFDSRTCQSRAHGKQTAGEREPGRMSLRYMQREGRVARESIARVLQESERERGSEREREREREREETKFRWLIAASRAFGTLARVVASYVRGCCCESRVCVEF